MVQVSSQVPVIVKLDDISEALECEPGWSSQIEGSVGSLHKRRSKLKRMLVAKPEQSDTETGNNIKGNFARKLFNFHLQLSTTYHEIANQETIY